jgi:hypothetical protein
MAVSGELPALLELLRRKENRYPSFDLDLMDKNISATLRN